MGRGGGKESYKTDEKSRGMFRVGFRLRSPSVWRVCTRGRTQEIMGQGLTRQWLWSKTLDLEYFGTVRHPLPLQMELGLWSKRWASKMLIQALEQRLDFE